MPFVPMPPEAPPWTQGPAKWAAIIALSVGCIAAITLSAVSASRSWYAPSRPPSVAQRSPTPPTPAPVAAPLAPTQPAASADTGTPIQQSAAPTDAQTAVKEPAPTSSKPTTKPTTLTRVLDLNTATESELDLLPGIGPALASRIVEHRKTHGPYKRVDDLDAVKGIGPKLIERIRAMVTVGPGNAEPAASR